jgi:hypothetical protein
MTMTSDRAKGQKFVKEAVECYERSGFQCWTPGMKAIFIGPGRVVSGHQDIADCFDVFAWDKDELHLIQVKSDSDSSPYQAMKLINEHVFPMCVRCVVMARVNKHRHTFRIWNRLADGTWSKPILLNPEDWNR